MWQFILSLFFKKTPDTPVVASKPEPTLVSVVEPKIEKKVYMISMNELLSGQCTFDECTAEQKANLNILLERINKVRAAYAKPMTVSSGLRTMKHHLEIYAAKGITDPKKIPMRSNHLFGRAVDIADADGKLKAWVKDNVKLMEEIGLWMEDFSATKTWLHFQINPPASGNRFFMP